MCSRHQQNEALVPRTLRLGQTETGFPPSFLPTKGDNSLTFLFHCVDVKISETTWADQRNVGFSEALERPMRIAINHEDWDHRWGPGSDVNEEDSEIVGWESVDSSVLLTQNVRSVPLGSSTSRGAGNICGAILGESVAVQINPLLLSIMGICGVWKFW